jgi:hypothetical protein
MCHSLIRPVTCLFNDKVERTAIRVVTTFVGIFAQECIVIGGQTLLLDDFL